MQRWIGLYLAVIGMFMLLPISAMADDMPPEEEKVIYLTFDDGPGIHTRQLLRILDRYGAKATFFLVDTAYCTEELLQQMVRSGHSIGIHSLSHDFETIYSSDEAYMKDALAMQSLIRQLDARESVRLVKFYEEQRKKREEEQRRKEEGVRNNSNNPLGNITSKFNF